MTIRLYNTLTRQTEDFQPRTPPAVNLYTCGPTVYHYAHIGNLRMYITNDVLRRTLEAYGYAVRHVMNITDVGHLTSDGDEGDDKLEKGAQREGKTVWDVAKFYTDAFFNDIKKLNIKPATMIAPATLCIPMQIEMIKLLAEKGFTYQTEFAVYFDTSKLADYGKLTGQRIEEKRTSREEIVQDPGKKLQADFAVWFLLAGRYKNHTMHWPSPWGEGFPGWHLECSAINWQYFPNGTDIHTGGIDHIPVHHTNEIAQYEAALDKQMAPYWIHGNFLVLKDSAKMAKSGDNFLTLQSLIDNGIDPLAYRYFALSAHYRSELQFSWEALEAAQAALQNLRSTIRKWHAEAGQGVKTYEEQFFEALYDDLNTSKALAVLWELVKSDEPEAEKVATIRKIDEILGLQLSEVVGKVMVIPESIITLAHQRETARKQKDFALADDLRKQIEEAGYFIEDTPTGPKISK